jgi:hypothetical protein
LVLKIEADPSLFGFHVLEMCDFEENLYLIIGQRPVLKQFWIWILEICEFD